MKIEKTDIKAEKKWEKANLSYKNYLNYMEMEKKEDKFHLTLIDLLYITNFKGGSATIHEPENEINEKLVAYTAILREIEGKFSGKNLADLSKKEIKILVKIGQEALNLVKKKSTSKIDGFGPSFLTTLLHFHFPNLYPILDRRVLNGLQVLKKSDLNSQKQVKKIEKFYPRLICEIKKRVGSKTVRELDRELFIIEFQ